jgi:hypothetical protein
MIKLLPIIIFSTSLSFANSGADLLMNETGASDVVVSSTTLTKKIYLDDPFLVLLYGNWKAQSNLSFEVNSWMDLIFEKKFEQASHLLTTIKSKAPSGFLSQVEATELYLYWKLGLSQTFFNEWLNLSVDKNLLGQPMGVALDQIIGSNASEWFIANGIQVSSDQQVKLGMIKQNTSKFNLSAQAWSSLRKGESAHAALRALPENDPLRFYLAQTIVLDYAKQGKMKFAAQFLKQVIEPSVSKSKNFEDLVKYHMLLARLLYQAGAMDASAHYYSIVPEKSRFFLQSRVERLWIYLRKGDLAQLKGDLVSLNLNLFADTFLPEIYLNSSIAHLKLCQFSDVKASFDAFISTQKNWRKIIVKNISAENPMIVDASDPYLTFVNNALISQTKEIKNIERLAELSIEAIVPSVGIQPHWTKAKNAILRTTQLTEKVKVAELKKRWENKLKIQDEAIRKMRFVKIELLSLVNRLAQESQSHQNSDRVTTYAAAVKKNNQIEFPYDGLVWGDEVFNLTAEVKNICLQRNQK